MTKIESAPPANNSKNDYEKDSSSSMGRAIKWIRASNNSQTIQKVRRAFAIFLAALLCLTIIGIIPTVIGANEWKSQQVAASQVIFPPRVEGEASESLKSYANLKFSQVTEDEVLAKQSALVSVNDKYEKVNLADLKEKGLLPVHKMQVGDVTYYSSKTFAHGGNHRLAIILVEKGDQIFPRLCYHSNSQGTWRVMPFAKKRNNTDKNGKDIYWYGKGQCETDTQLPIKLINALNELPSDQSSPTYTKANEMVITLHYALPPKFMEAVGIEPMVSIPKRARKMVFEKGNAKFFVDPKQIDMPIDQKQHPDFSKKVVFEQRLPHYGKVTGTVVASFDGSVQYLFYEANDGRAFLASVEMVKDADINSFGVRDKIYDIKGMDSPLLEYGQQVFAEFDPRPKKPQKPWEGYGKFYESDRYISNWNYVRELEIIKMYYQEQGREPPPRV